MLSPWAWANPVDNYDGALLGMALPQIQEGLGVADDAVGVMLAVVRLGVLPAVALTVLADHIGRRVLLVIIVGFTLATFATAPSAPGPASFMALQCVARAFIAAENMLFATVVLAEELDARNRGWGIGCWGRWAPSATASRR
ncbi:MAG: hypothetical protein U0802_19445 [Candidatus Binatia bacterium]